MTNINFRWMEANEVNKIKSIDRSERIRTGYRFADGQLQKMQVNWDSPAWGLEGEGEYTVAAEIRFCQGHLERNGRMYGAFDDETLVGIGIIQHDIAPETAQLAYLHVTNGFRKQGIGGKITEALFVEAKKGGAQRIYVSAVRSGSAVEYYLSQGFKPTDNPIPELFELEPEDIHMVKVFERKE